MTKRTLHYLFDLIIAVPLVFVGGWYIAADAYGLIQPHLFGRAGLIVKEGAGILFGTPLFLCGLWLMFRPRSRSNPEPADPPADRDDQPGNSN